MLFCQINQPQQNLLSLIAQLPVKKQLTPTVPKVFQNTLRALHAQGEKKENAMSSLKGNWSVVPYLHMTIYSNKLNSLYRKPATPSIAHWLFVHCWGFVCLFVLF